MERKEKPRRLEKNTDPVCGMHLADLADLEFISHKGEELAFCGKGCRERFKRNPEKFLREPLIRLENISKTFGYDGNKTEVLMGVSLNVWEGDFLAIVGASGSGKSTLLNIIGLLDRPSSGKMYLEGIDVSRFSEEERARKRSQAFGFVFQQYNLIPWFSAYDNIALPLIFAGRKADTASLKRRIEEVGLSGRIHHRPAQLSGGEQQRVALLRALINEPKIIIGDEPTGNLDSRTGEKILKMLIDLHKKRGETLIIVTHDPKIAEQAEEIVTIKDGKVMRDHKIHDPELS
jgi:ABC-type lipoprotein export system ATPase subunit/YHS domain-containing protein